MNGTPSHSSSSSSNMPSQPLFSSDSFFCQEHIFDTTYKEQEMNTSPHLNLTLEPFLDLLEHKDEELISLLTKEQENGLPWNDLEDKSWLPNNGNEVIEWLLKVIGYFSFSPPTAVLAVNYLYKFLYSFNSQNQNRPWVVHLSAVACLSLAAKLVEIEVPLLVDLQVEECKYKFDSKTIQRMEILVLSTLNWKMNVVTPFSFLEHIARRVDVNSHSREEFLRRCEFLILCLVSDCRFVRCVPSALATATMVHVLRSLNPCIVMRDHVDQLVGILGSNKEQVGECYRLIEEVGCKKLGSSPKRTVDASFSSDGSNDSWAVDKIACVCSSPNHLSKKMRPSL